jgi:hypothetical protein
MGSTLKAEAEAISAVFHLYALPPRSCKALQLLFVIDKDCNTKDIKDIFPID